jgi:hypothetical protein
MAQNERFSGVELLALYGEDDNSRMGAFLPGLKKAGGKVFAATPGGAVFNYGMKKSKHFRKRHGMGDDDSRMGAFLPGLKKVGKVTSGFTGGIAKAFLPPSLVNAASFLDPTKKGASAKKAVVAVNASQKAIVPVPKTALKIDTKKALIIGGGAVGALILLKLLLGAPRHS